uniref:Major facilitator superfamily (MFS) profile domain-containing protein n=1 Tax=Oncorhynchus mykiss TaxID=8022 RepID=A0A8C7V6S1_ONCMY
MREALKNLVRYWRLYLLTLVLGIGGSFQLGMQVSIMASPAEHIQSFVNQTWLRRYEVPVSDSTNMLIWSFIVSVFSLGGWVGAIHSGSLPVTYGRKKVLLFNNIVALVAAVLMVFSPMAKSFEMILLGRFLYGYNAGLGWNVQLMYLGESSPKKLRGFLTITITIFSSLGKVTGQIVGIKELMGTEAMWPWLMALGGLPAILQFVTLLFFPEAPRYLYIDKGDTEGCRKALHWLWQEHDLQMEMDEMGKERASMQGQNVKTIWDVLTSRCVRWQLLVLVIPCAGVQFCGFNAIYFYAFDIFGEAGVAEDKMHYLSIGIGTTDLITITLYPIQFFVSQQDLYSWVPYANIALIFSVICVYGLGPSGIASILPADIFLQAWRPSAYVISGSINWLSLFLIGMFFPFLVDGLGQFCFLIFVAYCLFSAVFVLYFIPETKGKGMVEIMDDFNKLNYKNRGTETEKADFQKICHNAVLTF